MKIIDALYNFLGTPIDSAGTFKELPYLLIFKTTNYCWFKCPHCCEKAGPDQEKTYIPQETITSFLTQAKQDSKFLNEVVFTGGEIFSSYKFGDKQYITNLLQFCIDNKIGADIKTNAGWANTSFGHEIFSDLKKLITKNEPGEHEMPKIQISLSLDTYHTNCFENNMRVIKELAGLPVMIHLSSFDDQEELLHTFEQELFKHVKKDDLFSLNSGTNYKLLNGKTLYFSSKAILFSGGRASKMNNAYQIQYPQFAFVSYAYNKPHTLVAFDNFGRVTLGENSGRKIMTPWLDEYKKNKNLPQIKKELLRRCEIEDQYYWFYERIFNPIITR